MTEAEAPTIDFAGAGRNVPWATWYEPNAALGGKLQIFASRFNAPVNTWVPEGQDRGYSVPSLNIHPTADAENPAVADGATVAGNAPVPWVAWQEQDGNVNGSGSHDQIFVSKGIKQAAANAPYTGLKPASTASVSQFCWVEVGLDRLAQDGGSSPAGDPTLNIDPSRSGVEPDIAFTGPGDTVAWALWYEKDATHLGLRSNEQVFAARIIADPAADGGFRWQAVGSGTAGPPVQVNPLDTSGPAGFGPCAASTAAEDACSLNADPQRDAEDVRIAAGTLTPGATTAPWATWSEDIGNGNHAIFVSRLMGGNHFELFNSGAPISNPRRDATKPDITFFGNTPYVSWLEKHDGALRGFSGHFDADGVFVQDTPGGVKMIGRARERAHLLDDVRAPISSACTDCNVIVTASGNGAVISSQLAQTDTVGILVQRIIRFARVHGKRVPVLKTVGRVPLGSHHRGHLRIDWNLKVNGHKLHRGNYLITLRGFDRHHVLLGATKPVNVRVH